ncbi:MAG TPA: FMN-binding glutamate synthase family protein [Xanthobacteraceae bacterium]|jgi:glutamate synthase domain-containing protein 2|nr:FMN-binding glutamate synthase family protein [Xanthobacteraceae bacterium]
MRALLLPLQPRFIVYTAVLLLSALLLFDELDGFPSIYVVILLILFGALAIIGTLDLLQTRHAVLRNYPLSAHIRFILEEIRPEIRQYFLESEKDGTPFSRDKRALVYQRAKQALDKRPFGTQNDVYASGFEWLDHSIAPKQVVKEPFRITIGGPDCLKPYSASIFNISAMSFGALSANAIRALNGGAKRGNFAHDTGEGGFSPYHRENGGDIIWEIGSGYFSCRNGDGTFCVEKFEALANSDQIKMVELKLSQGAKPGHGGVLPAPKVSAEIAETRGVPIGVDCISPARHSAFSTPVEMMQFIATMRKLSGGKPAGFKLCIGHPWEFLAICKAMLETNIYPDFIVVDGKEGGTGAAPLEFADHLGMPLREGLSFVHNALIGINARDRIKLGAAGKIISAFDIARVMALGADWCNSARGFMFALGCIQSQSCHTDRCPTGVSTQDRTRQRALVVPDKAERVYNFQRATLESLAELTAAAGLDHPSQFAPAHFSRRVSPHEVKSFAELYPPLQPGELIAGTGDRRFEIAWLMASAHEFRALPRAA